MKIPKTKLTILGIIMIFTIPVLWNGALPLCTTFPEAYCYAVFAGAILAFVGVVVVSLCTNFVLSGGLLLISAGISRIVAGVIYPPSDFIDPYNAAFVSHYVSRGYMYVCIGFFLCLLGVFISEIGVKKR